MRIVTLVLLIMCSFFIAACSSSKPKEPRGSFVGVKCKMVCKEDKCEQVCSSVKGTFKLK